MVIDKNLRALARQINSVLDRYQSEHNVGLADPLTKRTLAARLGNRSPTKSFRGPNTRSIRLPSKHKQLSCLSTTRTQTASVIESLRGRVVVWRQVGECDSGRGRLTSLIEWLAPARVVTAELLDRI